MNLYFPSPCIYWKKDQTFLLPQTDVEGCFLCTKATSVRTQQTQSRHTFCTKYFEAGCCLPDRALRGQDQPALTVAA